VLGPTQKPSLVFQNGGSSVYRPGDVAGSGWKGVSSSGGRLVRREGLHVPLHEGQGAPSVWGRSSNGLGKRILVSCWKIDLENTT